jgi:hypothetical protein
MSFLGFGGKITKGLQHTERKAKNAADKRAALRKRKEATAQRKAEKAEARRRKVIGQSKSRRSHPRRKRGHGRMQSLFTSFG